MTKLSNIEINGRTYTVCNECGAFVSSPRCLNCYPLNASDSFMVEELRQYYPKADYTPNRKPKPLMLKHHLLEYFFTSEVLMAHGRYDDVPEEELLIVRTRDHNRIIRGYKLHHVEYADERLLSSKDGVKELLSRIPSEVIEAFRYKE